MTTPPEPTPLPPEYQTDSWCDAIMLLSEDGGATWQHVSTIPHNLAAFDAFAESRPMANLYGGYQPWMIPGSMYLHNVDNCRFDTIYPDPRGFGSYRSNWFGEYPLMSWYRGDGYRAVMLGYGDSFYWSGGPFAPFPHQIVWSTIDRGRNWIMLLNPANVGTTWIRRRALGGYYNYGYPSYQQVPWGEHAEAGDPRSSYWDEVMPGWQVGQPLFDWERYNEGELSGVTRVWWRNGPGGIIAGPPTLRGGRGGLFPFGIMIG